MAVRSLRSVRVEKKRRLARTPAACEAPRSSSGVAVRPPVVPSRFGFRDATSGQNGDPLEVPAAAGGCGFSTVIGRVVIVELPLSLLRHEPKKADMPIGHDRPPPGSGIGIETATASGSGCGTSSSLNRRKPSAPSRPASVWSGQPHSGQATRCAAAAGVKRSRQSGQQTWVIADPFS